MFQKPSPSIALSDPDEKDDGNDNIETVVGPSVSVEGDFASEGNILVKGTVSGSVKTSRLLTVESGAKILANVKAGNALISGQIKGNVKVTGRLELTETAQVSGDICCDELVVLGGALIHGKITMGGINIDGGKSEKKRVLGRGKTMKLQSADHEKED